jgi:hypothetical protein
MDLTVKVKIKGNTWNLLPDSSLFFKRNALNSLFDKKPETKSIKYLLDGESLGFKLSEKNFPEILCKI